MKTKMYKKAGMKYKKGGSKPDYLDMDGDGNKKESMKSAIKSKKKMKKGGVVKAHRGDGIAKRGRTRGRIV